ncbi:MAG: class I SAM-dependent methyltransferase [Gammaproteobacteria bacterium]
MVGGYVSLSQKLVASWLLFAQGEGETCAKVRTKLKVGSETKSKICVQKRTPYNMPKQTKSSHGGTLLFARNFLKHTNMLGWFLPSSPFLVARVLRQVDWQEAKLIVEYGPGVGNFTTEILRHMRPDATLIAFETNGQFVDFLRTAVTDPRLRVIHGSAEEVQSVLAQLAYPYADYVISGIPFKTLPEGVRDRIVRATHAVLHPKGTLLVYQFSRAVRPYLQRVFGSVREDFELLNILPARLYYCSPLDGVHRAHPNGNPHPRPQSGPSQQRSREQITGRACGPAHH